MSCAYRVHPASAIARGDEPARISPATNAAAHPTTHVRFALIVPNNATLISLSNGRGEGAALDRRAVTP